VRGSWPRDEAEDRCLTAVVAVDRNGCATFCWHNVHMPDDYSLPLRQIDGIRGDLYAISEELVVTKLMLARLPTRAYLCRTLLLAMASIWALIGAVVLLVR
jgi:hypothetical protein